MKSLSLTALFAASFLSVIVITSQAKACAGCLDIYPEVLVLDTATQGSIVKKAPALGQGATVRIDQVSCEVSGMWAEPATSQCQITGLFENSEKEFDVKIDGIGARVLYNQVRNLTAEPDGSVSDEWQRTGERVKVAFVSDTPEKSTVSIPLIHFGTLSCPQVSGKTRCEMELNVLNIILLSYPKN